MASPEPNHTEAPTPEGMEIPLVFPYPSGPAIFANNFVVQFDGEEFHLSFLEIQPPILIGSPKQQKEMVAKLGPLKATPVARVVISKGRMASFLKVLQENAEKHLGEEGLK